MDEPGNKSVTAYSDPLTSNRLVLIERSFYRQAQIVVSGDTRGVDEISFVNNQEPGNVPAPAA